MDKKVHFKMYKSGKRWLVAGAAVLALAGPSGYIVSNALSHSGTVSAAETADATDNQAPTVYADDQTIDVGSVFIAQNYIQATDNVDGDVSSNIKITSNDVNTAKAGVYHVSYEVSDKAGNIKTGTMTVTVIDPNATSNAPKIVAEDHDVTLGSTFNPLDNVLVYDKNDNQLLTSRVVVSNNNVDTSKVGTYHVTYTITDVDGNVGTKTIAIRVTDSGSGTSTTAPILTAEDVTLQQGDNWDSTRYANAYGQQPTDVVKLSATGDVDTSKIGTYKVTYTATNQNNETTTKTITVTVVASTKDTVPPVIENTSDYSFVTGSTFDPLQQGVTAYDAHDGNVKVSVKSSDVDMSKAGVYHVTYEATDVAGNTSTKTITVTVTGLSDNTVPTITASDLTIEKGSTFDPLKGVSAVDDVDGKTDVVVASNPVDTSKPGSYTVVYTATDKSGNKATKSVVVKVVDKTSTDTTKPTISASDVELSSNAAFDPMKGVSATDDVDGSVPVTIISNDVNTSVKGVYHITYQASDAAGNTTTKTITVTVTKNADTTAPSIKASDLTIKTGTTFDPLESVSAVDDVDGQTDVTVTSNDVDTSKAGVYHVSYSAIDKSGNKSTITITVTVVDKVTDTVPPVIKASDITITQGRDFDPLTVASATDAVDGDVMAYIVKSDLDTSKIGKYSVTIGARDTSGNESTKTITVTVVKAVDDTEAPVITHTNAVIKTGDTFDYTKYVKVTDNSDPSPYVSVDTSNVNTSRAGIYTCYVIATDASGNTSSGTFTVTVTDSYVDTVKPVISAKDATLELNDSFDPSKGVAATDDHDGNINYEITSNDVNTGKVGTYHVTYKATDAAGNIATKTVTVTVVNSNDNDGHDEGDNSSSSSSNGSSGSSSSDSSSSNGGSSSSSSSHSDGSSSSSGSESGSTSGSKDVEPSGSSSKDATKGGDTGTTGTTTGSGDKSDAKTVTNDTAPGSDSTSGDDIVGGTSGDDNKLSSSSDAKSSDDSKQPLPDAAAVASDYGTAKAILMTVAAGLIFAIGYVIKRVKNH